jgi:hypothetical protein
MECANFEFNLKNCPCTWEPCDKKGFCCKCISYHKKRGELPACFFPKEVERTYDRSIKKFIEIHKK